MKPFIYNDWHVWETETGAILVSDESQGKLHQFENTDDAINWLFLNPDHADSRDAARALNKHIKATQ